MSKRVILTKPSPVIYGVEWNQNTDTWTRIDEYGNTISLSTSDFDSHLIWGQMKRCLLSADGVATFGENAREDGLDLTGASGRVMVRIPKFYVKSSNPSTNVYRWWISPLPRNGFVIHPAFVQRGGVEREQIYVGAYQADFQYDGDNEAYNATHLKLHSRTGKQPYTGSSDCIWLISIDDLAFEPSIGDVIAGTEGGFIIADYVKTAGAWGGGASGDTCYIWVQKPGDDTCGILNGDALTNTTQGGIAIGNVIAAPTGRTATIGDCRTLSENVGAGWGQESVRGRSAWVILWYIENATGNSQIALGLGIVSKASGTGFNGEVSGYDSADTNISVNGTGTGIGINGYTPVVYRGIENPWGNIRIFNDGYNSLDAEYRIINRDGTGIFADTLTAGNYESSSATPLTGTAYVDGYISNIEYENLLSLLFITNAIDGASNTYLCDYYYSHYKGRTNILLAGGVWNAGVIAGLASRFSHYVASYCIRSLGARLEANL